MQKLTTRIIFREYLKLLLHITYRKPIMIVIVVVDLLMITWAVLSIAGIKGIPEVTFYQYTTIALITFVQPAVIVSSIRKNYQSSAHLKENTQLEFSKEFLKITGESFYTELKWNKTFKIEEMNEWFLVYQNNFSAVLIPKRKLTGKGTDEFREFLKSIPGVKLELA